FFLQAEDGIRDGHVTGVQTCALPILFIGGKSMGGRIASQIAANGVDMNGLFFLGYPLHPIGKTDQLRDEHLYKIKKPMLFVSGTRDSFARRDLLEKVVSKIGSNAQIHWIENGDHSFK